mmetsp:Transcript_7348/g.26264  ORF Transcript_7348/g.26264 Transcript_7348/m.26264 type:complete len:240 (-) Transcript_7348:327-1046(-)
MVIWRGSPFPEAAPCTIEAKVNRSLLCGSDDASGTGAGAPTTAPRTRVSLAAAFGSCVGCTARLMMCRCCRTACPGGKQLPALSTLAVIMFARKDERSVGAAWPRAAALSASTHARRSSSDGAASSSSPRGVLSVKRYCSTPPSASSPSSAPSPEAPAPLPPPPLLLPPPNAAARRDLDLDKSWLLGLLNVVTAAYSTPAPSSDTSRFRAPSLLSYSRSVVPSTVAYSLAQLRRISLLR